MKKIECTALSHFLVSLWTKRFVAGSITAAMLVSGCGVKNASFGNAIAVSGSTSSQGGQVSLYSSIKLSPSSLGLGVLIPTGQCIGFLVSIQGTHNAFSASLGQSGNAQFFSDPACQSFISQVSFTSSESSVAFYLKDNVVETTTISANASKYGSASFMAEFTQASPSPSPTPSSSQTIVMGNQTVESNVDSGDASELVSQSATLTSSGILESLSIYINNTGGNLILGVYDSSGASGSPGHLLAMTASFVPVTGWNTQPVVSPVALSAGTYWLTFLASSNTLGPVYVARGSGIYSSPSYSSMPSSFGSGTSQTDQYSFYANLTSSGSASSPAPSPSPIQTFSTTFSTVENPISDGDKFITATTPGVNWSGVYAGECGCKPVSPVAVVTQGLAQSPNVGNSSAGDALAVLTGTWGADQAASAVVSEISSSGYEEIEIHLRVNPATGQGYEISWGLNNAYVLIATWNGGGVSGTGAYTVLLDDTGSQYAISSGDTVSASISGNVISLYHNGQLVTQYTDTNNTFTSGNPGFGFNEGAAGNYGITSFIANSMSPSPSPTATPSSSPNPSPTKSVTPSPIPTQTATPSPSPSPTKSVAPSPAPTQTVTPSPTATPTASPTPTSSPVASKNIYLAQSSAGAANGADCADAYAYTFFNTASNWGSGASQISPGTMVHLCGTFNAPAGSSSYLTFQAGGTAGNPVTLHFETGAVIQAPSWSGSVISATNLNYVTVDGGTNGLIQATANGTNLANHQDGGNCVSLQGGNNPTVENLTCANLYVHACTDGPSSSNPSDEETSCTDEGGQNAIGIYIEDGNNVLITNNTIHDAKWCMSYAPAYMNDTNITISNNTDYHCDHGVVLGEGSATEVVSNITISGNVIHDGQNWDDAANYNHHDGIHFWNYGTVTPVTGLKVYDNFIYGNWGAGVNAFIMVEGDSGDNEISAPEIFNNILEDDTPVNHNGNGMIGVDGNNAVIANNTINGNVGPLITGTGDIIENNIMINVWTTVQPKPGSSIATMDYNVYYNVGSGQWGYNAGNGYSFSQWQSMGYDTHSSNVNPNLTGGATVLNLPIASPAASNYMPTSSSTAVVNQGANLSSLGILPLNSNFADTARAGTGTSWNIGAY